MSFCVVAHFVIAGHRGVETAPQLLLARFWWKGIAKDIKFFVARCLHCATAQDRMQRPFGEAMHASKPNEHLYWDFLTMLDGYLLMIKATPPSIYCHGKTPRRISSQLFGPLLHWFCLFGVSYCWVTDQVSHFKNAVINDMQHQFYYSTMPLGQWGG